MKTLGYFFFIFVTISNSLMTSLYTVMFISLGSIPRGTIAESKCFQNTLDC